MKTLLSIVVIHTCLFVFAFTFNCSFENNDFCQWSNIALPPENRNKWNVGFSYDVPVVGKRVISNNNVSGKKFAYAQFYNSSGSATLISPTMICFNSMLQLSLQFYLNSSAKLFICRKVLSTLTRRARFTDCQALISHNNDNWTSQSLSFLPERDPYQVVIRAYGFLLTDFVAIDDITIKCTDNKRFRRDTLIPLQVITYENWARMRAQNPSLASEVHYGKPSVMLIVSDQIKASSDSVEKTTTASTITTTTVTFASTTTLETTTTSLPTTTLTKCNNDFCVEKESSEEVVDLTKKKPEIAKATNEKNITVPDLKEALSNLAQWVQLIRNMTPVLPMIPSFINSFKKSDAIKSTATNLNTPIDSMGKPIGGPDSVFQWKKGDTRYHPSEQLISPIIPIKVHHLKSKTLKPAVVKPSQINSIEQLPQSAVTPSPYEAPLYPENELRSDLNLSSLTMAELRTLESIHKKIFTNTKSRERPVEIETTTLRPFRFGESKGRISIKPVTMVPSKQKQATSSTMNIDRPKQQKSKPEKAPPNGNSLRYLTPQMVQEINMFSTLPYFDELTEGLDLSLVSKPGGFALLRKQVMERMISNGLYNVPDFNKKH